MMFKKKNTPSPTVEEKTTEKPIPAFLWEDYPYKVIGEAITDLDAIEPGLVYEIKCPACEMSIRTQGMNIKIIKNRLLETGCIGCGNKELVVKQVDMSEVSD